MEVISELHLLEQVASEQHIGTLAENLLEVIAEHPSCYDEVRLDTYKFFESFVQSFCSTPSLCCSLSVLFKQHGIDFSLLA